MEIPDIKTLQYKKLKKRLKRAKNKYSTVVIKKTMKSGLTCKKKHFILNNI